MKKRVPIFLGLSLLTGAIGSIVLKRRQPAVKDYYKQYVGQWAYQKNSHQRPVMITVTPEYKLLFQDRQEPVSIVELSPQRLVFLDRLGYSIIFEYKGEQLTFYDETEGTSYPLNSVEE
ncbi:DUF4828 domain-containing protein [Enterococcus asini]|uniref:DUF4828 domain-containing protein n=1 Tax=Enterococcus asini TaxID=57732 RepID=A0AAW8TT99_9ENTE|nr:DUF4828 domain-containing protein [Enterococcus asini]MDT2809360.1 DUF4828 domain-containing protein [Enterococcus asini]